MTSNRHVRYLVGLVLGGCAGLSLTVSILPMALYLGRFGEQLELTMALAPLWPWVVLVWAAGGLSVGRVAAPRPGMAILTVVGLVTGGLTVAFGLGTLPAAMFMGVMVGGVYGGLGGMLLGRILTPPPPEESE